MNPVADYFDISLRISSCACLARSRCESGSLYGLWPEQDSVSTVIISIKLLVRILFIMVNLFFLSAIGVGIIRDGFSLLHSGHRSITLPVVVRMHGGGGQRCAVEGRSAFTGVTPTLADL